MGTQVSMGNFRATILSVVIQIEFLVEPSKFFTKIFMSDNKSKKIHQIPCLIDRSDGVPAFGAMRWQKSLIDIKKYNTHDSVYTYICTMYSLQILRHKNTNKECHIFFSAFQSDVWHLADHGILTSSLGEHATSQEVAETSTNPVKTK